MAVGIDYEYLGPPNKQDSRTASSIPGGNVNQTSANPGQSTTGMVSALAESTDNISDAAGRRVRLRPKPAAVAQIYGPSSGVMGKILTKTRGVVWPFQPTISYAQQVDYTPIEMVHSIQEMYSYKATKAPTFTVNGQWSVQSHEEGLYAMACIRFFQTVTKMYFGGEPGSAVSGLAGTPPPVLLFDAYGQNMFNCLPVIVTNFTLSLPAEVDYYPVNMQNMERYDLYSNPFTKIQNIKQPNLTTTNVAWLPVLFTLDVSLTVQNTPKRLRSFNLDEFRSGKLIRSGGWV